VGQKFCFIQQGWHPEKEQYGENQYGAWMNVDGHAVANGVYVAANRIGLEQYLPDTAGIEFWELLHSWDHKAKFWRSHDKEEILIAEVDLDLQENVRQNWPFFRDRRIDALETLLKEQTKKSVYLETHH
jgi:N-carbamoylputrescine amidase